MEDINIDLGQLLSTDNFLILNFNLIKSLGLDEAVLLTYLITRYRYFNEQGKLLDGCAFYAKREEIEKWCGISEKKQRRLCRNLKDKFLLEWVDKGVPMKRYYILNFEAIVQFFKKKESVVVNYQSMA